MTIESPLAHHRPPDDFNPRLKFNSNRENSTSPTPCFHDYARRRRHSRSPPPLVRPKMSSEYRGPQVALRPLYMATPDHALTDLSTCPATSPEYMYEDGTGRDTKGVLLSPCTSDGYHGDALPCDDDDEAGLATCDASWGQLDGPPLQDYLCDIINGDDGSSIKDIGDALVACIGSTEEPVRILGLKDAKHSSGPTLAQLNDRESVLDVILAPPGGGTQRWVPQTAVTTAPAPATTDAWTNGFYSPARPAIARTVSSSATLASSGMLAYHNAAHTPASSLQELLTAAPDTSKAAKRPREDNDDEDGHSDGSMERKWEEIRCYIDSNIKLEEEAAAAVTGRPTHTGDANNNHAATMATVAKRIKVEPQDTVPEAFTSPPSQYTTPTTPTLKHSPADNQEYPTVKEEPESDYDNSDDDFSDIDSDASYGSFVEDLLHGSNTKKEKRYFWQYNTQSKGPKGKRLCKSITEPDPHSLADFEDPVFQPDVNDARYKHNGKARKGDGNDITPNSWKLFQIGNELQKLNKKINGIAMTEKPQRSRDGVKSKSRKEKNKFASRACRLKKKAQHEANKLKLFGLEQEHYQLMEVLKTVKAYVYSRIKHNTIEPAEKTFTAMLEDEIKNNLTVMIGGNTSDYVNAVLQKVAEGDKTGGIHRV